MWLNLSLLIAGLGLLYCGAEGLVRGSSSLATRFGINPLIVGITIVAYGTSMPELVVSVQAALQGSGDIAVGNIIGSNICTIGIVLGVAALVRPLRIQLQMLRRHVPLVIFCSIFVTVLLRDARVDRLEGLILFLGIIAYTAANLQGARQESNPDVLKEFSGAAKSRHASVRTDALLVLGGLVGLMLGGDWLLDGAVGLANHLQMQEAVIGLTVVAIGTSFPDLMASVVAAARREPDIAVGNAIGSILFNLLNALAVAALIRPLNAPGIQFMDCGIMIAMAVMILPLMRTGFILQRWEGGLFVIVYIVYIFLRWP